MNVIGKINKPLYTLYKRHMKKLENKIKNYEFDGPLLMQAWEDEYLTSEYKILFVGREHNGWMGDLVTDVDMLMEKYKSFGLVENGDYTTFWQYIYEFKNILMPKSVGKKNFLWTNISKFSTLEGKALKEKDFNFFTKNFHVFEEEIKVINPDIIIFFTNYTWDEKIKNQLSAPAKFIKFHNDIPEDKGARVECISLPFHTYRVPHPITMQTKKEWNTMLKIMATIKSNKN
jgi:hypothetical protein